MLAPMGCPLDAMAAKVKLRLLLTNLPHGPVTGSLLAYDLWLLPLEMSAELRSKSYLPIKLTTSRRAAADAMNLSEIPKCVHIKHSAPVILRLSPQSGCTPHDLG